MTGRGRVLAPGVHRFDMPCGRYLVRFARPDLRLNGAEWEYRQDGGGAYGLGDVVLGVGMTARGSIDAAHAQ